MENKNIKFVPPKVLKPINNDNIYIVDYPYLINPPEDKIKKETKKCIV